MCVCVYRYAIPFCFPGNSVPGRDETDGLALGLDLTGTRVWDGARDVRERGTHGWMNGLVVWVNYSFILA